MREISERAWLLEWGGDEAAANAKARAAAAALRASAPAGLLDAIPAARTVLVLGGPLFDPAPLPALEAGAAEARPPAPRTHEIRFTPDGADRDEIAARCGLTPPVFLEEFTSLTFTVGFLGFTPGFAYLYGLPPAFRLPRRPSPRTLVPAGSIALAGPYVGIYPGATPGGWNLLGTTARRLFDLRGDPPFLLSPGDVVRFVA